MADLSNKNRSRLDKVNKNIEPVNQPIPQLKSGKRPTRVDQILELAQGTNKPQGAVTPEVPTPTPTPTPTNTPTLTLTSTPTPTVTSTSTPTPTVTSTSTSTPTSTPTPTVTSTSTSTPTPTPTPSDDGLDYYSLSLQVAGTAQENPPFDNKYRFRFTNVGYGYVNDLGTQEVYLGNTTNVTGRINTGDDISLVIERVNPDDTTSAAGSIAVSVTTSPGSITPPSGKSTNYNFNSGTTIDGGTPWTWTVTGAGEPTELQIIVTEGV